MSKKNILLIALSLILLVMVFFAYRYLNKPHRNIEKETAAFERTAEELGNAFKKDPSTAYATYLDRTVIVSGTVSEIDQNSLVLGKVVFARFENLDPVEKNTFVRIKGRCIGYDDLLEEVKFEQCHLLQQ